ncbi:MAG TPA: hypothetical protein VGQ83_40685 [Polyangia bacterium]|jgi:hypothetical protein
MHVVALIAALILGVPAGCGRPAAPPARGAAAPASAPATLPGALIAALRGSCARGLPLGAPGDYRQRLRVGTPRSGMVRVRATPAFDAADRSNALGELPGGTVLAAQGPLKNPEYGNAVAYAVAVRDLQGRTCRGYVSYTAAHEVDP